MHEKNREYNGYTNYETWNFKLWIDSDKPTYDQVQTLVKDPILNHDVHGLANALRYMSHDDAPELKASFYSDVMNASIREVDYHQVAKSLLEDAKQ